MTEVITFSKTFQMSGPLLELRGGHVVVFHLKVRQVTQVRQHINNVSKCSKSRSPLLARGSPLTLVVPV